MRSVPRVGNKMAEFLVGSAFNDITISRMSASHLHLGDGHTVLQFCEAMPHRLRQALGFALVGEDQSA